MELEVQGGAGKRMRRKRVSAYLWERGVLIRGLGEKEKGGSAESPQDAVAFTFRDTHYCGRKLAQKNPKMEYFTVNFGLDFSEES